MIRENGRVSKSPETRQQIKEFEHDLSSNLDKIQRKLRKKNYRFEKSRGILSKKPGKATKRPLVVSPIESRIVQRALLDVAQGLAPIRAELCSGFNFGGVEGVGFGVPDAVIKAQQAALQSGFWIRTDIKSFFVHVPRIEALKRVLQHVGDPEFASLFQQATETELNNLSELPLAEQRLFPLYEEGVAQGCCLSPLLCNLYLADFDRAMNERGVTCIRYIDDFILFAKDRRTALMAFSSAKARLEELGLEVYEPSPENIAEGKAQMGRTSDAIDFLGCTVRQQSIIPSRKNRIRLLGKVGLLFEESVKAIESPENAIRNGKTYGATVQSASNCVRAWGNTYSFCNDDRVMKDLDLQLDDRFSQYNAKYREGLSGANSLDRRRLLGFFSLSDCNRTHLQIGV